MLEKTRESESKKLKASQKDTGAVDSILQSKPRGDQNSKTFSIMEKDTNMLEKWKNKLEIPNLGKTNKNKSGMNEQSNIPNSMSFAAEASERFNKLKSSIISEELLGRQFRGSEIFLESDSSEAKKLYLAIPELENGALDTVLIKTFKTSVQATEIIRIFVNNPYPSVFLFQTGVGNSKRIFGGYASENWGVSNNIFGTPSCFLFLITKDEQIKLRENPNPPNEKKVYLWKNNHSLSFGELDLVLTEEVKMGYI